MKIEIDIGDDITTFAKALNNACVAYGDVIYSIFLRCEISSKLQPLKDLTDEELQQRFDCLKSIYKQIEEIEKKEKGECL